MGMGSEPQPGEEVQTCRQDGVSEGVIRSHWQSDFQRPGSFVPDDFNTGAWGASHGKSGGI